MLADLGFIFCRFALADFHNVASKRSLLCSVRRCASLRRLPISPSHLDPRSTQSSAPPPPFLPPVKLYRRLLRAHRKLDADMRAVGDNYIKDEFRRHRSIDNPLQIVGFLSSWKMYLDQLEVQQGQPGGFRGQRLDPQLLEKMSDEQIYQIHDLMTAPQEAYSEKAQATLRTSSVNWPKRRRQRLACLSRRTLETIRRIPLSQTSACSAPLDTI